MEGQRRENFFMPSWNRFWSHAQSDVKLMLVCVVYLSAYRIFMMLRFSDHLGETTNLTDLLVAMAGGLRYDLAISGYTVVFSLLLSIICGMVPLDIFCGRLRKTLAIFYLILTSLIMVVNYVFFLEYRDNFNHWVFGVIFDDFGAVMKTVWTEYPVVILSITAASAIIIFSLAALKFIAQPFINEQTGSKIFRSKFLKFIVTLIFFVLFTCSIRGSVGSMPIKLRDADVTGDPVLNKFVLNPYFALRYTLKHYSRLSEAKGIEVYLPDGNVRGATKLFFNKNEKIQNLDHYMKKSAKGNPGLAPEQIFILYLEGFDSWSLLKKYASLDLQPKFKSLAREGIFVRAFLPTGRSTMTSLASIMTGLPEAGVFINYQKSAQKPYPTSLATQFEKLGYETNLFYGGYLSWQRLGHFAKAQGFDNVYGGGSMGSWVKGNEWGVDDEVLFDFILKTVKKKKRSVNLILSTSNHGPYDLPVFEMGFKHRKIPEDIKGDYDGNTPLHEFGHLWYTDKVMGEFIRKAERKLPFSVFAVTGDHMSRRFLNSKPTMFERASVPLLLYGKNCLGEIRIPERLAGSHLNIIPTLIELAAPEGFEYYSFLQNLLDSNRRQIGFGYLRMITPNYLVNETGIMEPLPFRDTTTEGATTEGTSKARAEVLSGNKLVALNNAYLGLSWWRIMRGAGF